MVVNKMNLVKVSLYSRMFLSISSITILTSMPNAIAATNSFIIK